MRLTKYLRCVELDNQVYAVYNTLIEKVMYVNKTMLSNILLNKNLEKDDIKQLKKYYIYENFFTSFINSVKYKSIKNKELGNNLFEIKQKLEKEYLNILSNSK